jgi:hypothetical protein
MIASLMMCLSAVVLPVGMLAGIAMGIQQNFALGPAHAHLNLIGGVLLFLFGPYYKAGSGRGDHDPCQGAGLAPHDRRGPVSGRRRPRAPKGGFVYRSPQTGWAVTQPAPRRVTF